MPGGQLQPRQPLQPGRGDGHARQVPPPPLRVTRKATKTTELLPLLDKVKDYDVVGIDEGQFFPDVVEFCDRAANLGKTVVVAALDGTFERKPFRNIVSLIPLAEKVSKFSAVCVYCTKEAAFTRRAIASKQVELIGGAEMYKPVCRGCFFLEDPHDPKSYAQVPNPEKMRVEVE